MDNYSAGKSGYYTPEDLKDVMEQLWSQQILWTRFYLVSAVSKLPDLEVVENRLLESPRDFANVFRIYYGDATADQLESLIREHLTLTVQLINAFIEEYDSRRNTSFSNIPVGSTPKTAALERQWRDNADTYAAFLAGINPYWDQSEMRNNLSNHLDMTKDEITKRIYGQYAADVYQYDFIEYHALMLAGIMADGIIKQFYT